MAGGRPPFGGIPVGTQREPNGRFIGCPTGTYKNWEICTVALIKRNVLAARNFYLFAKMQNMPCFMGSRWTPVEAPVGFPLGARWVPVVLSCVTLAITHTRIAYQTNG